MNRLEQIARTSRPSAAIHLRAGGYRADEIKSLLCDVLALANGESQTARLLLMGVVRLESGERRFVNAHPAGHDRPDYAALINHYIEPALKVTYGEVNVDGAALGVLHIQRCNDLPYLMRIDHCANLRRGDGFTLVGGKAEKMGRTQLDRIFARKFNTKPPKRQIDIGFAGAKITKEKRVTTADLSQRPSELARGKIGQFMHALETGGGTGATSVVQRLNYARIFGTDKPYEKRSQEQLKGEFAGISDEMWKEDQDFLFRRHGQSLEIVVRNTGEDALLNVKFELSLPRIDGLHVANADVPPQTLAHGQPTVRSSSKQYRISTTLAHVNAGSPVDIFKDRVRYCASKELAGKRLAVEYEFTASNLKAPVLGCLHISL